MITGKEIGERFIRSVEIFENMGHVGPSGGSSFWMAVPYTDEDRKGWGDERKKDEEKAFYASLSRNAKPWQVTEAEETQSWLAYVEKEEERTALASWAHCMATNRVFKDWCKRQGIHQETGRRRKERAILRILLALERKPLQHNDIDVESLLPDTPDLGHKSINIGEDAPGQRYWRNDDAKPLMSFDEDLQDFSWAEAQNEKRRQREAKRRAEAA